MKGYPRVQYMIIRCLLNSNLPSHADKPFVQQTPTVMYNKSESKYHNDDFKVVKNSELYAKALEN